MLSPGNDDEDYIIEAISNKVDAIQLINNEDGSLYSEDLLYPPGYNAEDDLNGDGKIDQLES